MASFSGRFQLTAERAPSQDGACTVSFDAERLQVIVGGRPLLACDLGDIDVFAPGDYLLDLTLYTGQRLRLLQFGKVFDALVHDLLEAHRARVVACLLLEDLDEVSRFTGTVQHDTSAAAPAEIRLYRSNLAFLPTSATAFQWRLADIERVDLDPATYVTTLASGSEVTRIGRLAKRTEEFRTRLQTAIDELATQSAAALQDLVPFLSPDLFASLATTLKEGHSASLARLNGIDKRISQAIVTNVVDATLRPYYEVLAKLAGEADTFAGFKMIRPESEHDAGGVEAADGADAGTESAPAGEAPEDAAPADAADAAEAEGDQEGEKAQTVLHWFFFHVRPPAAREPVIAWEATSHGGRATYLFRASALADAGGQSVDATVDRLGRGLGQLNFRREPIYLPDAALEAQPRFHRYAIARRRLSDVGALRAAFIGRAIHSAPDAWRRQLDALLAR